jgi:hypothetical protein
MIDFFNRYCNIYRQRYRIDFNNHTIDGNKELKPHYKERKELIEEKINKLKEYAPIAKVYDKEFYKKYLIFK